MTDRQKLCFVIGPIGLEGSATRDAADWLLQGIIKPVLESDEFGYDVKRADKFAAPGLITDQIITAAITADLVIADLTGQNANAFYELAIRHMAQKPIIHMYQKDEAIPFDVKDYRAIPYSITKFKEMEDAKTALAVQVRAIQSSDYQVSNPVTKARGHQELSTSGDPKDKLLARALSTLELLTERVEQLEARPVKYLPPDRLWGSPSGNVILAEGVAANALLRGLSAEARERLVRPIREDRQADLNHLRTLSDYHKEFLQQQGAGNKRRESAPSHSKAAVDRHKDED